MGEKISSNPIPPPQPSLHPLVLLAPDSINPHLLNKRRTLTLLRAMEGYGGGGAASRSAAAPGDGWEAAAAAAAEEEEEEEEERFRGWEMVADGIGGGIGGGGSFDDCAIFPPSLHEGLHLRAESNQALVPLLHQEPSHSGRVEEEELEEEEEEEEEEREEEEEEERGPLVRRGFSDSARQIWDSGIEVIQSKISLCGGVVGGVCATGAGVWSVAAMSVFAGVLMYMRRRDRRERDLLLLLVQEKDKKRVVNHLVLYIIPKMSLTSL
ncbi:zinc finger and BTB domain-containing protein 4-like isoform X2 [Ananas comosus]|uniref:Zinc finger and BTB domain-containing protein 4-like isoform X2 n=1 Tax=Ananas comosus TaxID=4615 RepID=A0A6P5F9G0_ANACO|nr:zinc finger and BTB domain-containing protein 4-like isoform X2 [Ananas comosus]